MPSSFLYKNQILQFLNHCFFVPVIPAAFLPDTPHTVSGQMPAILLRIPTAVCTMRALPPAHRQCTLPGLRTSACQKALPACSPQHRLPSKRHAGQNPNAHTMRPSRSRRLSTDPPLSGTVVQLQAALQFSLPGHRRVLKSPGFHNHQTRHCQDEVSKSIDALCHNLCQMFTACKRIVIQKSKIFSKAHLL